MALVDHVGRKSGKQHTSPLIYGADGDDLVIVASFGGAKRDPSWWPNLKAHPDTTVQIGSEKRRVRARQATPEEKQRLWPKMVAIYAPYEDYQRKTERDIPVVLLEPAAGARSLSNLLRPPQSSLKHRWLSRVRVFFVSYISAELRRRRGRTI